MIVEQRITSRSGNPPVDGRRRVAAGIRIAGWAGVVGPILFVLAFLVQEAFRRQEYSPLAETVSGLEAGPNGWVQQASFVVFGLLTMVFAAGLHRGLRPSRAGFAGPVLLGVSGIALVLAGVFPLREDAAGVTYDPGGHLPAGVLFFVSTSVGLIVISRRAARDAAWPGTSTYLAICGGLGLVGFVMMGRLVIPEDAPLHEWAGLAQRLLLLIVLPARVVLALRLLQVSRGSCPRRSGAGTG